VSTCGDGVIMFGFSFLLFIYTRFACMDRTICSHLHRWFVDWSLFFSMDVV